VHLVLLGPPGAGKGTQGQALAVIYGVPHIATGDIIRDHIARQTEFGRNVEAAIAAGNFVSDEDIYYWVGRRLAEPDAQAGYVLDGFPRDVAQAEAFHSALDAVIDLEIAEEALIKRLSKRLVYDAKSAKMVRRPDDAPQAVRHRLKVYRELTAPLQAYYDQRGLLRRVDGTGSPQAVTERIRTALAK
jgi:adenylate kinase